MPWSSAEELEPLTPRDTFPSNAFNPRLVRIFFHPILYSQIFAEISVYRWQLSPQEKTRKLVLPKIGRYYLAKMYL